MDLSVELAPSQKLGLPLRNPIMIASGFGGYSVELAKAGDLSRLGALVTGPVSRRAWPGAAQPRLREVPGGYLARTGKQNPGLRSVLRDHARAWANLGLPIIVRLAGADGYEQASVAARLESVAGVAGFEMSIAGSEDDEERLALGLEAVEAVREATVLPLIVSLPFPVAASLPRQCAEAGADALCLTSSLLGTAPSSEGRAAWQGQFFGPAVLPLVLREFERVAASSDLPLIGRGGIHTSEDALAFLRMGAQAVQIDSAVLRQPTAPWDILAGLEQWMAQEGARGIAEVIGSARRQGNPSDR
ncbi:MAG: hypothetical protein GXY76_04505 [Chloroflexi bacterium]|nr:hypothetical protein [Chloroflexota bacterium]